jgi:hypothetical protein
MNNDYHDAITIMPNGQVFGGEHDSQNGYPKNNLIATFKKNKKGLISKTIPYDKKIAALVAKIAQNGEMPLSAAATIADKTNISHLQMIRLYPEAQGAPTEYFYLDEMFVSRDVPQLEARETFYDTTATAQYLGRLEESNSTHTVYDEIKYNLLKLTDKVYTPIEDIMRTIINPQTVDLSQLVWAFKWKRNQAAAAALATMDNTQAQIDDPTTLDSSGFHSKYHIARELNDLFNTFLQTNDIKITHVAMNPSLFTKYSENTWTVSGPANIEPVRLAGGGIVPLPGIPGVTAVVDVAVPNNTIYAINKPNALRLGEGPKIMRRYYDEERDAEAIKYIDFNQYLAVAANITQLVRKFDMTIPVASDGS